MSDSSLLKSARGSAYNIAVSGATILLGFTRTVLLMRLLRPEQFGVVALALFFTAFVTPFSSLGIDGALIQRKDPRPEAFSTHFILRISLGLAALGLGWLASPALRQIYSHQALVVDVFLALLAVKVLEATYATPVVLLQREMRFGPIAVLNLLASLAMTITAPLLAYLGAGLWSLVAEQAVGPVVRWIGLWVVLHPWRLSWKYEWEEVKSAIKFGSQLLFSHTLGILLDRFDDFWTGTALGAVALGIYSRAYEIAQYPERVLATPITNVFFSTYSRVQDDKKELAKAFFRSSSFLVRAGFLLAVVLMAAAPEIATILFGQVWLPIVPIFRLLLIYMLLDPLYANLSYLLVGVGQPSLLTRVRVMQAFFFILAVIALGSLWGTNGVAMAANLMMLGGTVALILLSRRFIRYSLRRMFFWPLVAGALAGGTGLLLTLSLQGAGPWGAFLHKAVTIVGIYCLVLYFAEWQVIREYGSQILRPVLEKMRS